MVDATSLLENTRTMTTGPPLRAGRLPEEVDPRQEAASYRRLRRSTRNWLLMVVAGLALAVLFRNHERWGDGEVSRAVHIGGAMVAVVAAVLAFRANGRMHEQHGLYRGMFGKPPPEQER
jgi:membrane associated rhomboid family serine protease